MRYAMMIRTTKNNNPIRSSLYRYVALNTKGSAFLCFWAARGALEEQGIQ
jgi:hypothetical protein